jgi:dCMP deaminase
VKHETDRNARPAKYLFTVHAEANALFNAARRGNATEGAWAYVNWDPRESICAGCAGALIQSGIGKIIGPASTVQGRTDIPDDSGWRASCRVGVEMLGEAGVEVLGL